MTILGELAAASVGIFVGENQLTLAILALVAAAGSLVDFVGLNQLIAGADLLLGCAPAYRECLPVSESAGLRCSSTITGAMRSGSIIRCLR
jgi:hypothetical protein